jgi:hypothetical protein
MKIERMKKIEFKMITKPDLTGNKSGWMQVRVDISHNGLRKVTYVVESNGFGDTALVGRNSINDVKDFIAIWNEHPMHNRKLIEYCRKIISAYKIVIDAEKNMEVA